MIKEKDKKIKLYNLKLLDLYDADNVSKKEIVITGDTITFVGDKAPDDHYDENYDLRGNVVMPTFKNTHTHSAMTFLRSSADDMPLLDWLEKQVFPKEAVLASRDIYKFSKLAILEYLASGTSLNFDMYMNPEEIVQAAIDMNFRTIICGAVTSGENEVPISEERYNTFNNYHELVGYRLGFHGEYTISDDNFEKLSKLSAKLKAPVYHHSSEGKVEVNDCIAKHGLTPVERADKYGILNHGGGIFHGIHLTDNDIKILLKHDIYVASNPCSNSKLSSGICDLKKLDEAGVKMTIATDGPASNNALSMFREMYLASVLQKLKYDNAGAFDPMKILRMATINGAEMLGLDFIRTIEEGQKADILVIDMSKPNMQPINNIAKNIVYSADTSNVYMTIVNGKILFKAGEYMLADSEKIIAEANEAKDELLKRVG